MKRKLKLRLNLILTKHNVQKGVLPIDGLKLCGFEISHDLDKGGVPDDVQDITHPSVTVVEKDKMKNIWLAATPYPQTNRYKGEPYENTCVFYAPLDNGVVPIYYKSICKNPIILKEGAKYNSDCDIMYCNNEKVFYAITRKRLAKDYTTRIVMQKSSDGQHWSDPVVLFDTDRLSLCPCFVCFKGKYLIYLFNTPIQYKNCETFEVWESDSLQDPKFKLRGVYDWTPNDISIWHGDVDYIDGIFYMVFCGSNTSYTRKIIGGQDKSKYLWIAKSVDGINWSYCKRPLLKINGTYRSTFFVDNKNMTIYISFLNRFIDKEHPAGNQIGHITIPMKIIESLMYV